MSMDSHPKLDIENGEDGRFTLRIAPVVVQLTSRFAISTVGYNGIVPGPLLRMREGVPVTVDITNDTDVPELVHWHGLVVPSDVDGSMDEGTPFIAPHSVRRYRFIPWAKGARWYHTNVAAGIDLYRGLYTGQFGFLYVEPKNDPGAHDQEFFLSLREWEPSYVHPGVGPSRRASGLQVGYSMFSINDKSLGAGDPIRVRLGQRVLFHFLNASATESRTMALPGHQFEVVALDGNPVPHPQSVDALYLGPGERVDALVTMNYPGVWILGCTSDNDRNQGLGIVVEYAYRSGFPQWVAPPSCRWGYARFGRIEPRTSPDETINLVFETVPGGPNAFDTWRVNGKPSLQRIALREGLRYRLVMFNRSDEPKPVHLHRHIFEITGVNGRPTGGIMKDTVMVPPAWKHFRGCHGGSARFVTAQLPHPGSHGQRLQSTSVHVAGELSRIESVNSHFLIVSEEPRSRILSNSLNDASAM